MNELIEIARRIFGNPTREQIEEVRHRMHNLDV
jgi:hypothetical protein